MMVTEGIWSTTCGASSFLPGETDTGVVQIDSLRLDVAESVRQARAFLDRFDELVEREAGIIRANDARLVIADAPARACDAAAAGGGPAVVWSNCTDRAKCETSTVRAPLASSMT